MKSDLPPAVKVLALKYYTYYNPPGIKLRQALKRANEVWDEYQRHNSFRRPLKPDIARTELVFRGFIPIGDFTCKPGYGYIVTNSNMGRNQLIYPQHFGYDYKSVEETQNNIYTIHGLYGLENYTQVYWIKDKENGNQPKKRSKHSRRK